MAVCVVSLALGGVQVGIGGNVAKASSPALRDLSGWLADPPIDPLPDPSPGLFPPGGSATPRAEDAPGQLPAPVSPAPVDDSGAPPAPADTRPDDPASPQDCQIIRSASGRIDALAIRIAPASDPFPTKESGELVVESDLRLFNSIVSLAVSASVNLENAREKNKFEMFKNTVIAMSTLYTERRSQDLTKPATAEWAARLAQLLDSWSKAYALILNSCYI
ncbi:hypothetical protein [Mycobacterium sp. D16R24]|uniref:hypothetical protein n=1 Tax=Mycobacterium sp. D16R24 TaxID=1855656 RepID=UPI001116DACF|nr:hypothetical protein [Mycobacterium sp. D16R24]